MSTTDKKTGGGRYSIKIQFTLIFFLLMLGAIGVCWIINSTFLERYYTREKRIALTQIFHEVNEASKNESIDSDEFDEKMRILAGTENVSLIVMNAESATVKMHASDSSAMVRRMWDNLFGKTPSMEQSEEAVSRYYVYRKLAQEDKYSVSIIYDSGMKLKSMELFGVLDDGSFCLLNRDITAWSPFCTVPGREADTAGPGTDRDLIEDEETGFQRQVHGKKPHGDRGARGEYQ